MFDLQNVAPNIRQIDGEWRYDSRNSVLEWSIVLIDDSNRSGSMEFVVPPASSSAFFPISVRFSATSTFSDMKVIFLLHAIVEFRQLWLFPWLSSHHKKKLKEEFVAWSIEEHFEVVVFIPAGCPFQRQYFDAKNK
ncbi:hypothetical protein LXL04_028720 [Taraxacum kok-saghyz]